MNDLKRELCNYLIKNNMFLITKEQYDKYINLTNENEKLKKGIYKICGKPQKGYGYCNKHYIRFKKYGDPLYTKYRTKKGDDENE